jgi:AAA domain
MSEADFLSCFGTAGPALSKFPSLLTGENFIAGFAVKRPLIRDWDLKPGWLYTFTAPTGGGKTTIALAEAFRLAIEGKHVVYLAGENADDVRARAILMKAKLELDRIPDTLRFVDRTFDLYQGMDHMRSAVESMGSADLIVVDTSPAFMMAAGHDDENSNPQALRWALRLRELTRLAGDPTTLALCHPPKRPASMADCLPRGGGALLAEVDGNYTAWPAGGGYVELGWTGKFRGNFMPLAYRIEVTTCDQLRDEDGNPVNSVWGSRASQSDLERGAEQEIKDEDAILAAMSTYPGQSLSNWAERLGWQGGKGKNRAHRAVRRLSKDKLVRQARGGAYALTTAGEKAAAELRAKGAFPEFHPTGEELAKSLLEGVQCAL